MNSDILEVMRCRNCKYWDNGICKISDSESLWVKIGDNGTCANFTESIEYELIQDLLKNPNLFNIITERELDKKIVGEYEARKTIFLVTCMRLVENLTKATDNLMVNAISGTGKDHISEAIFQLLPENEREELIKITAKVLAYTRNKLVDEESTWKKIALRLEDIDNTVLIDNSFKVMLSANPNGINKAKSVWKGRVIEVEIEGKPSIILTIAEPNIKNEQLRRLPICDLDEGIDQTKEVLKRQAEFALEGKAIDYDENVKIALGLLKRVKVRIPFATKLISLFNPQEVIVRTHFPRFLDYIKASCALYQYQREQDNEGYLIAMPQDYNIARIALIKTTSNILMIPLTKLQKSILTVFEDKRLERNSIEDLQNLKEIQKINITEEWLRKQLDFLASKGFLIKDKEKRTDEAGKIIPKPVFVYSFNKLQRLDIPEWKDLDSFSSNTQNKDFNSNSSITSISGINEVIQVNEQKISITDSEQELQEEPEEVENG